MRAPPARSGAEADALRLDLVLHAAAQWANAAGPDTAADCLDLGAERASHASGKVGGVAGLLQHCLTTLTELLGCHRLCAEVVGATVDAQLLLVERAVPSHCRGCTPCR